MVWASEVSVVKFKCQDTPIACLDVLEDVFKCNCVIPVFIRPHMTFFPLHNSVQFHISIYQQGQRVNTQPMILKLCVINEKRTCKYWKFQVNEYMLYCRYGIQYIYCIYKMKLIETLLY